MGSGGFWSEEGGSRQDDDNPDETPTNNQVAHQRPGCVGMEGVGSRRVSVAMVHRHKLVYLSPSRLKTPRRGCAEAALEGCGEGMVYWHRLGLLAT